jgi:hypothetical protein
MKAERKWLTIVWKWFFFSLHPTPIKAHMRMRYFPYVSVLFLRWQFVNIDHTSWWIWCVKCLFRYNVCVYVYDCLTFNYFLSVLCNIIHYLSRHCKRKDKVVSSQCTTEEKKLSDTRNLMLILAFFYDIMTFLKYQISKIRERKREKKALHSTYIGTRVRRNMTFFLRSLFHNSV